MQLKQSAIFDSDKKVDTGAYSPAVLCDGWLYVSGYASIDQTTGRVIGETIEEQTLSTLQLIEKLVKVAGGDRRNIVKCAVHLADIGEFDRFNLTYASFFEGQVLPARTTVGSQLPGIKIEIDAVAFLPTTGKELE
jgi:2-iminobutanoate/2-iminopropanoate deaminase